MRERVGGEEREGWRGIGGEGGLLCRICHQIHFTELLSTAREKYS